MFTRRCQGWRLGNTVTSGSVSVRWNRNETDRDIGEHLVPWDETGTVSGFDESDVHETPTHGRQDRGYFL